MATAKAVKLHPVPLEMPATMPVHRLALSLVGLGLVALLPGAQVANPILTFEALTPVALKLQASQSATVKYMLTNQAVATKTFSMQPATGVTQMEAAAGD